MRNSSGKNSQRKNRRSSPRFWKSFLDFPVNIQYSLGVRNSTALSPNVGHACLPVGRNEESGRNIEDPAYGRRDKAKFRITSSCIGLLAQLG